MIYTHNALVQLLHISISYPGMQRLCDEGLEECRDIQTDEMMTIAIKSVIVPILYYCTVCVTIRLSFPYYCPIHRFHRALRLIELASGTVPRVPAAINLNLRNTFACTFKVVAILHSVVRSFELGSSM